MILAPTAEKGGAKWFQTLKEVLGMDVDERVRQAVVSMIEWRNAFVHAVAPIQELMHGLDGAVLKSWSLATRLLALSALKAVTPTR
jgi:hypothetical protein